MSVRSNIRPYSVITNGDMSLASVTSLITVLQSITIGTYTYSWSGSSPIGIIQVEISNDYSIGSDGKALNAGTWIPVYFTLNGSSVVNSAPVTGNSGVGVIEWSTGAYAIKTIYTKTSGTGTIQALISGKVS